MARTTGTTEAVWVRAAFISTAITIAIAWLAVAAPAAGPNIPLGVRSSDDSAAGPPSERHRIMADCLWLTARNHGFYAVQQAVLDVDAALASSVVADGDLDTLGDGATDHALWQAFLASIGADTCGFSEADLVPLTRALTATRETAARHFAASDAGVPTWTSRAVTAALGGGFASRGTP